eukprot:5114508-Amphidinium_carterae.1
MQNNRGYLNQVEVDRRGVEKRCDILGLIGKRRVRTLELRLVPRHGWSSHSCLRGIVLPGHPSIVAVGAHALMPCALESTAGNESTINPTIFVSR